MFSILAERGVGPKLHAVFPGGRLEEYLPVSNKVYFFMISAGFLVSMQILNNKFVFIRLLYQVVFCSNLNMFYTEQ